MHRLTFLCIRHPWLTVAVVVALIGISGRPILHTDFVVGMDATLGADHPAVRRLEAFLESFGGGYPVLLAYECGAAPDCGGALDPVALEMAYEVSRELAQSPFVTRISSPATTPLLVASADLGIEARRFVVDGAASADLRLRELALTDRLWSRTLVSPDGRVGAIAVELASSESEALLSVVAAISKAVEPHAQSGFRFHPVGEPILWVAAHESAAASMLRVAVGTGGMLFATLLLLLRSLPAVAASLVTIGANAALTLASLPILGWQRSELTEGAATVILVIGCASCVHFCTHYLEARRGLEDDSAALLATTRWLLAPCFLTSATTVASFLSLASGGLLSMTRFGLVAAIGVALAFPLTFSLLPALLVLLPGRMRSGRHSRAWEAALSRLSAFGVRRGPAVVALALASTLFGLAGVVKLHVEPSLSALWDEDHPVTRSIDFVAENLQHPGQLEIEIRLPEHASVLDPRVLRQLGEAERALERMDGIERTRSLATLLHHANRVLRPSASDVALLDSASAVGELMVLLSAGDPAVLDPWLTFDQTRLRISAETRELSASELERLLARVEESLRRHVPQDWGYAITGPAALAGVLSSEFKRSQTAVLSVSSGVVCVMIGIYLRSLPWALLALIPNVVALLILFGVMGHLGMRVDFGAAVVAPIAIGIAADDSIHFLTAYARGRRSGREWLPALRGAITGVGEAVTATSTALALGFLSMLTSPIPSISKLGLLSAIAIVAATLADLLLLPALIAGASAVRARLSPAPAAPRRGSSGAPRSDVF